MQTFSRHWSRCGTCVHASVKVHNACVAGVTVPMGCVESRKPVWLLQHGALPNRGWWAIDRQQLTRVVARAVLKGGKVGVRNANRNEPSRGRSLRHGQDMGKTQNHRSSIEQWLAVGGGWRLVAVGGWWLVAVGDWWRLVVGGPRGLSLRAVLNQKIQRVPKDSPGRWSRPVMPPVSGRGSCHRAIPTPVTTRTRQEAAPCSANLIRSSSQSCLIWWTLVAGLVMSCCCDLLTGMHNKPRGPRCCLCRYSH